jgi:hypothetical protein
MFMEHLWELKLKDCSYETLEYEFIQRFGTNEPRTIKRYLGTPEQLVKSQGSTKMMRMNRQSGKVAVFEYYNEKRIPAKKGLMEILGFITRYKQGNETRFRINHETMPYYTQQTTINEHQKTENNQESKEESQEAIKEDLRVCSLYINPSLSCEAKGEWGKLPLEEKNREVSPETKRGDMGGDKKEEEESYRAHTHKNLWKIGAELGTCIQNRIQAELFLKQIQQATQNQTKGETNHEQF